MLSYIFTMLFYGTLFIFVFIKIFNYILIKRYNCKESYKKQREEIQQTKFSKLMKILILTSLLVIIIYIPFAITTFGFSLVFMIFDSGEMLNNSFSIMSIILYIAYFIIITEKLYIDMLLNNLLRKYKNV